MSKRNELFKPKLESKVGMYNWTPLFKPTCVTAYDFSHIGHARFYINFDLLFRQKQTVEKGPDILRSAQEGDSSGHAESLPATLAEHQQHSANFQQSEFGADASHIGEGEILSEVFIRSHGEFRHTSSRKTTSSTPTPGNDLEPSELASLLQFRAGELITE